MTFPTWRMDKMAAGTCNSIAKNVQFFGYRLSFLHNKWTYIQKIFQGSSPWTRHIHFVHKTIQNVKAYYNLNGNIAVALTVSRFRYLVEFQGVMEQNISRSPRY